MKPTAAQAALLEELMTAYDAPRGPSEDPDDDSLGAGETAGTAMDSWDYWND